MFICLTLLIEIQPVFVIQDQDSAHLPASTANFQQTPYNSEQEYHSYASYLRGLYTSMSLSHTSQHWTHLPRCEVVQLAMISSGGQRRGEREEEMVRQAQQGRIETILSHKQSIDLNNLFLPPVPQMQPLVVLPPPPPHPKVILIEGAPGGGKSTLALHICHRWAQYAPFLDRFDIVVLAYLRDQTIQNATTLADILPARTLEMLQIASQMQSSDGANILFIFDGWDEFPHNLQVKSLVSTIIRQPHKLSLHHSTILITSRPVSSGNLLHIADRRLEILGFTQHQIREYIEKALDGNSTHIQKLIQHLEEHPVIEGYCYVPLHVAILVHIFLTMKGALPTTHHELFCNLVLCCIVRELETHESENVFDICGVSSLDDLPGDLRSKLIDNHCVLAFRGVVHDRVVFYEKDLVDFHFPTNLPSLGLLQSVEGLTVCNTSLSYNFLHLSVQELLSAYHISKLNTSKQFELIRSMFGNPHFKAVLHYYSGFTKLANPAIQDFICTQQQLDILPLLHCFYEAQDPTLCKLIKSHLTHSKISFNFELIPVDYLAIGYFVTSLLSVPSSDAPNLHIRIDNTDDHKLKLLLVELSKYSVTASALPRRLELELYNTGSEGLKLMASHLKQSNVITELTMEYHDSAPSDLVHLAQALYTNTRLSKCKLIGKGNRLTHRYTKEGYCLAFSEMFQVNKSLTNFCFKGILLDLEACLIFKGLQCNATLTHLDLSYCNISWTTKATAQELTTMLQVNKILKHLDLSEYFSHESCPLSYYVFQGLLHNESLVHLNLSNVGPVATEDTIKALSKMLQVNNSLKHLDLSKNDYSDFGVSCIFQSLQHNTALVHLNLSDAKIKPTENTLKALRTMLQVNKSLTHLNLSGNELSGSRLSCVFHSLHYNTTLIHLNLSRNYGFAFTDALYSKNCINKTLTHLNLSYIWGLKFHIIFRSLQHNTSLVHLYLRNTGLVTTYR